MLRRYWIFALILVVFSACNADENVKGEKTIEEIKTSGKITNSDIIRNPVTANGPEDTVNIAKIVFEEKEFNFGRAKQGDIIKHTYVFTNTGKVPLLISNARSSCGCTVPKWPTELIEPGGKGEISVEFDSKGRKNRQVKEVTITANTYPSTTKVKLEGFIEEEK